jgi:Uncharacterized conserved protein (COG2071)
MDARHLLQRHPIPMTCHFEHSLVVAWALPAETLEPLVPPGLTLDVYDGRWGLVVIALVQTRNLRPASPGRSSSGQAASPSSSWYLTARPGSPCPGAHSRSPAPACGYTSPPYGPWHSSRNAANDNYSPRGGSAATPGLSCLRS